MVRTISDRQADMAFMNEKSGVRSCEVRYALMPAPGRLRLHDLGL